VRCATERHDQLDRTTLQLVARRYLYPDGYSDEKRAAASWRATYLELIGVVSQRQAAGARRYHKELWEQTHENGHSS